MTARTFNDPVSRRSAFSVLGGGALALALATQRLGAAAQDATPEPTTYPTAGHPITGVWQFDNELRQPGIDISNAVFTGEGNYVAGAVEFGYIAVGIWRATGERTAELFYTVQEPILRDAFTPDYAAEGATFGPLAAANWVVLEVNAAGNSVTGMTTVSYYQPDGTIGVTLEFPILGTRMIVDPTAPAATPTA